LWTLADCILVCKILQLNTKYLHILRMWSVQMLISKITVRIVMVFIVIMKPARCTNFSNLFCYEILHVSDSSSVQHLEFFTLHSAMVYVIQVCRQLASRIRMFHPDPARTLSAKVCDIYHCCVYSERLLMMGRGTVRNM
jgi:hypothetical protein